jgi:hypothetical protein
MATLASEDGGDGDDNDDGGGKRMLPDAVTRCEDKEKESPTSLRSPSSPPPGMKSGSSENATDAATCRIAAAAAAMQQALLTNEADEIPEDQEGCCNINSNDMHAFVLDAFSLFARRRLSEFGDRLLSFFRPVLGLAVIISASFVFASCSFIVKIAESVDIFTFSLARSITFLLISAPILIYLKKDPFPKGKLHIPRA